MSTSTRLGFQAVLSIVVGVIAIVWPGITVGAFVILYAVWLLVDAGFSIAAVFGSERTRSRAWYGVLAAVDVLAAVLALAWPDITALVLVLLVAGWGLVGGVLQVVMAFASGASGGERAFFVLTGLLSVSLAVAFVLRPDIGAYTIAMVYGFFSIASGVAMLVTASSLRSASRAPLTVG